MGYFTSATQVRPEKSSGLPIDYSKKLPLTLRYPRPAPLIPGTSRFFPGPQKEGWFRQHPFGNKWTMDRDTVLTIRPAPPNACLTGQKRAFRDGHATWPHHDLF